MSVDKLVTDILGERPTVKDRALRELIDARMKKGGEVKMGKGGAIKSLVKAIAKELPEAKASQKTQIPGTEPTYRKAYDILEREKPGGRTLDYGAGLGHGSRLMGAESFEPFPREGFKPDFIRPEDIPTEEFDRLVNLNVLNVMPREMRDATVENIGRVMRPGGMGIVTTRGRDVLNAAGEAGPEPMSKITSIGTYQKGFSPEELREYLKYMLGEGYDISRLNLGPAGAVVRKKGKAAGGEVKMGKGGLLKKAAKVIGEIVEPALPATDRQANLERFLEDSVTKQRLYHGTNRDISSFESGRPVQWLAENPELANQFVAGGRRKMGSKPSKGSAVYPVRVKVKNPLDLTDATPQKAISTVDFLKQAGVDTSPENLRRLAEWDYELTKAYGGGSHLEDPVGSRIERMQYPEPLWSLLDRHMVIKALEDQGYDSVKLTEKFGNKEPYGESQTIGVFNPANIKSATGNVGTYDVGTTDINKAKGGEVHAKDGGPPGKNVGRGMAGLRRSREPLDPKEIQAMMLDVPAGVGIPFAEAGAEYLRGNVEDAETSAAIDAALTAVPVVGALAKPAYRAVKSGVKKAAPAVREAASGALESAMESGLIQGPSYAVKPTGGQWLGKGNVLDVTRRDDSMTPDAIQNRRGIADASRQAYEEDPTDVNRRLMETSEAMAQGYERTGAINNWIDANLQNYVRRQMGTPDDPVLKLAEQGILHMPYQETSVLKGLAEQREKAGFPAEGLATTGLGRMWETMSDRSIGSIEAGKLTDPNYLKDLERRARENDPLFNARPGRVNDDPSTDVMTPAEARDLQRFKYMNYPPARANVMEENQWLSRVDPETPIYSLSNPFGGSMTEQDLGFDHVIDVLRADLAAGRMRPEQLSKMSMEQAVRRTHEYDLERAAAMAKAAEEETANLSVAKSFDDGFKIVQLDKPGQFAKESDRMGHSVRGYEPSRGSEDWIEGAGDEGSDYYGHGGWGAIKSGEAQVFSIRDAKNQPHVTIELGAKEFSPIDWVNSLSPEEKRKVDEALKDVEIGSHSAISRVIKEMPEYQAAKAQQPKVITQIKGKQNRKPDEKYLPYVQQFIREGNYEIAGDLRNSGLIDLQSGQRPAFVPTDAPRYVTQAELDRMQRTGKFEPDFKEGGAVQGYAKGGAIKSLIKKASEALGEHEGKRLFITQSDRTKVGGKYLGGPGFSSLQLTEPFYRDVNAVWGVKGKSTASTMINAQKESAEPAIWTTFIGSPEQHKSNQQVFDEMLSKFRASAKKGNLDPDLRAAINAKLASAVDEKTGKPLFPDDVDILSPKLRQLASTFDRRGIVADLIGGKGIGGKKGQIIDYQDILDKTSDPMLVGQPTYAVGPRLFELHGDVMERPDLHPAFPVILTGRDLDTAFSPVPHDLAMKDLVERIGRTPGHYDLTRGGPSQFLSEEFLTGLQKSGYKNGGAVGKGALPKKRA